MAEGEGGGNDLVLAEALGAGRPDCGGLWVSPQGVGAGQQWTTRTLQAVGRQEEELGEDTCFLLYSCFPSWPVWH